MTKSTVSLRELLFFGSNVALLTACVLLSRNAVLRARELYADARSLGWHGDWPALSRLLRGLAPIAPLGRLASPHPDPARRLRLLDSTDEMFRFRVSDAFGVGVGAGFIVPVLAGMSFLALVWFFGPVEVLGWGWIGLPVVTLVVVPLMAGAIAIGAWRSSLLRLVGRSTGPGKIRLSFACALGVVIGAILPALSAIVISGGSVDPAVPLGTAPVSFAAFLCGAVMATVTITLAVLLGWIEAIAFAWLAISVPRLTRGTPFTAGLALCLGSAAVWSLALPFAVGVTIIVMREQHVSGALGIFWIGAIAANTRPVSFVTWPSIIALWALPLSAGLFARRTANATSWAFEAGAAASIQTPSFGVRSALVGIGGGIVAVLAMSLLYIPLPATALLEAGLPAKPDAVLLVSRVVTGVTAAGLIGLIVAATTSGLPVIHAVRAGFFASLLIGIGEIGRLRLTGWRTPLDQLIDLVIPHLLFGGVVASLAGATIACVLKGSWRLFRPASLPSQRRPLGP